MPTCSGYACWGGDSSLDLSLQNEPVGTARYLAVPTERLGHQSSRMPC